ncbi:MAG: DUF362 domain-containing protein [archaeon]|nr:DUF362 domain-containing protein [archaeon]
MKPIVYFSNYITPESSLKLFRLLNLNLTGKTAVKVHSGELGNQNIIPPEFYRPLIYEVTGTICECNTAYEGARNTTEKHIQLMNRNGWTKYFKVDICDADGDEAILPIPNGFKIKENYVGSHLLEFDSMLVVSHFKGHPSAGFGGALKQLSIGCASQRGKCNIHSAGSNLEPSRLFDTFANQEDFIDSMADAASSITNYFRGNIAYINIAANLSRDCDCCSKAENPCMENLGLFASLDPVAIDLACIDAVLSSNDKGKDAFMKRVNEKIGTRIFDSAAALGVGKTEYELICID